jgi:hypothetical protein
MSTYSITAPRFTEDDDRQEQESLAPAELAEIKNDMFGTAADSTVAETPAIRIQAALEMEKELARIPAHDKREYTQALEVCPELFRQEAEADPFLFLRCEDFHAQVRSTDTLLLMSCTFFRVRGRRSIRVRRSRSRQCKP